MKPKKNHPFYLWRLLLAVLFALAPGMVVGDDDDDDDDEDSDDFVANEMVVKLNPLSGATIEEIHAQYATTTLSTMLESAGIYLVSPPETDDVEDLADLMEEDPRLLYVEPNYIASVPQSGGHVIWAWSGGAPVPGAFPDELLDQDAVHALGLPLVRSRNQGEGIVVAILDTGVDLTHPNLAGNLLDAGYDFVDDDAVPQDERMNLDADADGKLDENFGHGTHVAGTVLLSAPGVSILPIRVLDAEGRGNVFTLKEAIDLAIRAGADIINLSLGMNIQSEVLSEAIERAEEANVLVVAAAGNANSDLPHFPAANEDVLGVASVDVNDTKSVFTNWGDWVGVSAPGERVISAFPGNTFATWSGTSMATPLVAGQAALLKAFQPELTVEEVIKLISVTASNIDALNPNWREQLGTGRIDMLASFDSIGIPAPGYDNPVEANLGQLSDLLELSQDTRLVVRTSGILGESAGLLPGDDAYRFSDGNGASVILDLDERADLDFSLESGIQLEVLGELVRVEGNGMNATAITHEIKAVWIRLPNGTALDLGESSPLAGAVISDWFGFFRALDTPGSFYHTSKGLLSSSQPLGEDGWFFSLNREDWIYASRVWYPFIFSASGGWHYLVGNPYGGLQHAYSYIEDTWMMDFWAMEP